MLNKLFLLQIEHYHSQLFQTVIGDTSWKPIRYHSFRKLSWPVADRNQVAPEIQLSDILETYGTGVDPTKPSNVATLYPISGLTIQAITGQSTSEVFNFDRNFVAGGLKNETNTATTFPDSVAVSIGNECSISWWKDPC